MECCQPKLCLVFSGSKLNRDGFDESAQLLEDATGNFLFRFTTSVVAWMSWLKFTGRVMRRAATWLMRFSC